MGKNILFMLLMTTVLLVACGDNNDENSLEESSDASVENIDNDTEEDKENIDNDMNDDGDDANEFSLVDVSLDISEEITKAYDYFDELYFSDTEIIDEEIALKSADVTIFSDDRTHNGMATLRAYTIEPQNSFDLAVDLEPEKFEDKLTNTDADGNKMAVEVADDAYEYADKLIWKKDNHVYQLSGGRSVVSTNKENEIHPEEDRLLFYEELVPTGNELKTYDEFYQNVLTPTQLPEGFTLYRVTLFYDQPQGFSTEPPARIIYETRGQNNEFITFHIYGEYEEAPKLSGDNIKEENILQTAVQTDEEQVLFSLEDTTYKLSYLEVPEETILEIAESIIEQAK